MFDDATIKGEFDLPWARRLQSRQFYASGSRSRTGHGGRSRSVNTPRTSSKTGRGGSHPHPRGRRSKSIRQAQSTSGRSTTQSPRSNCGASTGAGMDDSASVATTGQSDTGDLSIGVYVSTTNPGGKSAGPVSSSHSNSEAVKKSGLGASAPVIPSWLIEKYALQPVYEFSEEACDLLRKLLERDSTQRLGGLNFPSRTHLHSHPFFATLDWVCILRLYATIGAAPPEVGTLSFCRSHQLHSLPSPSLLCKTVGLRIASHGSSTRLLSCRRTASMQTPSGNCSVNKCHVARAGQNRLGNSTTAHASRQ